ncbi:MAG TPA: M28 family metallopeptidase [Blastocatellia bacterium]|nr:M28 family metallopeptidase [Blastocatellia bacterium]
MKRVASFLLALLCGIALLPLPRVSHAQSMPFLSDEEIRMLTNEISGDRSFEHIRWLTHWHRDSGMEGYFKAADYVVQAAKDAGLADVRFVEQPLPGVNYTARSAELWMVEPVEVKLADIGDHAVYLADGSHDADVTAELVWIDDATNESLKNLDVAGKIVLTSAQPSLAAQTAVWEKGAAGIVSYATSESKNPMDRPDQIAWNRIPVTPPSGKKGTFAFMLPPRKGDTLRRILGSREMQDLFATGKRARGGRVVLRAKVDTEISPAPGRTGFVEGWIRGSKYHDQQVVLTAHLQEEQGSANDDGSGCGNLLELARVFNKLIREGKLQRPLRDIRFWWTDEIYSEYRYFGDHPEETKNLLANVHQDMTGANQALGSRVQHLIFAPHSRTSYLDAIFESAGTYVLQTNNSFLSANRQGGLPRPHSRPIYSTRGTRQGYNGRFVPYFGSSDHMCFVDGGVGVPAVALINWDDEFIHSSDDDLDKVDQTQLQRNNFIIGSIAYFLAFKAERDSVPLIAGETFAQGARRLANDLNVAMRVLRESGETPAAAWKLAKMVIEQGVRRERAALESIRVFTGGDAKTGQALDQLIARVGKKEGDLMADLQDYALQVRGSLPDQEQPTPEETAASRKIPANAAPLATYFEKRGDVDFDSGLHGLMRSEVFNFVDGKRSYYDIYKAVNAEAMAGGSWYYGTVTLKDVVGLLDAAVRAKALTLK